MTDPPGLTLALADGRRWLIRPGDERAGVVVAALGAAMGLAAGGSGRELVAVTSEDNRAPLPDPRGDGPLVCPLPAEVGGDMLMIQMNRLALLIARDAHQRGGVLLHGALAAYPQGRPGGQVPEGPCGVVLAGPGTVGKTTASNRLPPPWRSLSDDAVLVVRDDGGRYWAHPWPTWSRFLAGGPGGSWEVQHAVALGAIFFLTQSPEERVTPLNRAQAAALLMGSAQQASGPLTRGMEESAVRAVHREHMDAVHDLAPAVPTRMLHLSLDGAFWEQMERALSGDGDRRGVPGAGGSSESGRRGAEVGPPGGPSFDHDPSCLLVAYTGPSMNPTLREPDLLEVRPYGERPVRVGDVIHFLSPTSERWVVHRVVGLTPAGARTRGDANASADPGILPRSAIAGRVVAAQRGRRRRRIAGGLGGVTARHGARARRAADRLSRRLLHGAYHALARTGALRRLLPPSWRPRVLAFRARHQVLLKLVIGRRVIGRYEAREERWHIRRPYRLFVDESVLPRALGLQPVPRARSRDQVPSTNDPSSF